MTNDISTCMSKSKTTVSVSFFHWVFCLYVSSMLVYGVHALVGELLVHLFL